MLVDQKCPQLLLVSILRLFQTNFCHSCRLGCIHQDPDQQSSTVRWVFIQPIAGFAFRIWSLSCGQCQVSPLFFPALLKLNFRHNYCLLHSHQGIINSFLLWETFKLIRWQHFDLPIIMMDPKYQEFADDFFPRFSRSILAMTTFVKIPISRALLQEAFSLISVSI